MKMQTRIHFYAALGWGGGGGGQQFSFLLDFSILRTKKETSADGAERKCKAG